VELTDGATSVEINKLTTGKLMCLEARLGLLADCTECAK
jgi:hypothetical protein